MKRDRSTILDFDGTICNLSVDWAGLRIAVRDAFRTKYDFRGAGLMEMVRQVFKDKEDRDYLLAIIRNFEQPGGRPLYRNFNDNLIKSTERFWIVSNNLSSTISSVLADIGILSNCVAIVGLDNVLKPKPDIEPYMQLQSNFPELNSTKNVYFGDSDTDRLFAQNCGMEFQHVQIVT